MSNSVSTKSVLSYLPIRLAMAGIAAAACFAATHAEAAVGRIRDKSVEINNRQYWRTGAEDAGLGCVGYKRPGVGLRGGSFEKVECPPLNVAIDTATEVVVDSASSRSLGLSFKPPAQFSVNGASQSNRNGSLRLRKLCIEPRVLEQAFEAKYVAKLRDIDKSGGKLSTVLCVWLLVEGNESATFSYGGAINATVQGYQVGVSASGGHQSKVSFSPNTIVAYEQGTIEWTSLGKTSIKKIDRDVVGID